MFVAKQWFNLYQATQLSCNGIYKTFIYQFVNIGFFYIFINIVKTKQHIQQRHTLCLPSNVAGFTHLCISCCGTWSIQYFNTSRSNKSGGL